MAARYFFFVWQCIECLSWSRSTLLQNMKKRYESWRHRGRAPNDPWPAPPRPAPWWPYSWRLTGGQGSAEWWAIFWVWIIACYTWRGRREGKKYLNFCPVWTQSAGLFTLPWLAGHLDAGPRPFGVFDSKFRLFRVTWLSSVCLYVRVGCGDCQHVDRSEGKEENRWNEGAPASSGLGGAGCQLSSQEMPWVCRKCLCLAWWCVGPHSLDR